jgi:hypothetical protein
MNAHEKPAVAYWHLWTDERGVSHQTRCEMKEFELKSMSPPAAPQWQGHKMRAETTVMITVQPVGWTGDWHENPKPQWIVPLSGRWFVESMDGARVEMGPGEISFGADQNTSDTGGRKGHRSGTIGTEPAVLMVIQLEAPPAITGSCPFR